MSVKYLDSSKVKVFPSAYRGNGIDPESFLLSEGNLTSISNKVNYKHECYAYIEDDGYLAICLGGYLFHHIAINDIVALFDNIDSTKDIYVGIYLENLSTSYSGVNIPTLVAKGDESHDHLLDFNSKFNGLCFTQDESDLEDYTYTLDLLWKLNDWEITRTAQLKFTTHEVENVGFNNLPTGWNLREQFTTETLKARTVSVESTDADWGFVVKNDGDTIYESTRSELGAITKTLNIRTIFNDTTTFNDIANFNDNVIIDNGLTRITLGTTSKVEIEDDDSENIITINSYVEDNNKSINNINIGTSTSNYQSIINLKNSYINGDLLPSIDVNNNIGDSQHRWGSIYASYLYGVAAKIGTNGDPTDVGQIGGPNYPIYINTQGIPHEANKYAGGTKVILNGSNLGGQDASFYAPTTKPSMTVLYSNKGNPITQDSTTITLTDTFNNFDFIEIIFSISSSNVSNATNSVIISSRSYNSMVSSSYPYELNVSSKDNNKNITLWGGYSNKVLNITKTFDSLYLEIVGIKLPIFD